MDPNLTFVVISQRIFANSNSFSMLAIPAFILAGDIMSVSYTHLDVYKRQVISSCIAILINICLNYVLIFGKFGAPALGVAGAAVATLIARVIEVLSLIHI